MMGMGRKRQILIMVTLVLFLAGCLQNNLPLSEEVFKSDVTPGVGPGQAPEGIEGDGPWNHRLLIALSNDGINWRKTGRILSDQASVPDVIMDKEGFIRVYYVDFYNRGIIMALSKDLEDWNYIKVKGISEEWVDPSIVLLPNGSFRLYASYMPLNGKQNKIVSAISKDGINFKIEDGYRYESDVDIVDPDVIFTGGKWIMFLVELTKPEPRLIMLESEDGLNFGNRREVDLDGNVPCIIQYKNGYMLYLTTIDKRPSIVSFYSEDLDMWESKGKVLEGKEEFDRCGVADPAVIELKNGSYLMIYKTWIENPWNETEEG